MGWLSRMLRKEYKGDAFTACTCSSPESVAVDANTGIGECQKCHGLVTSGQVTSGDYELVGSAGNRGIWQRS